MVRIRRFEESVSNLFADGFIPGFLHLYIGQEAVAAGVCTNLRDADYITSTHRGHGHCIAKGAELHRMAAELFGKSTGYCRGKGGSMHVADVEKGILGANGIVGAGLPIAVGAALSSKIRNTDQIAVSFFGEGATGTGYFHESLNMASVLNLPVIFVCESNHYAEFTPRNKHVPVETVAERAAAYGFNGKVINGDDVLEVYSELNTIVKSVRKGQGPFLVECLTNRWRGHYEGDPQQYRPEGEVEEWKMNDPISSFVSIMRGSYRINENEISNVSEEVEKEIDHAIQFAKESPLPAADELLNDVYA
jgi:TPP-dependent pyruvate/acetoin dehydrogenase alpha subunit